MRVGVGDVTQSPEEYELWAAKGKGKNIPIRRGNKQHTEMGLEELYRN